LGKEKRELESVLAKTQSRLLAMKPLIDVVEAYYQIDIKNCGAKPPAKPSKS